MNEKIIDFKSEREYFNDEKDGLKNHIEHKIDMADKRFHTLLKAWKEKKYPLIRINLVELARLDSDKAVDELHDMMYSFIREITHISVYQEMMSITWGTKKND